MSDNAIPRLLSKSGLQPDEAASRFYEDISARFPDQAQRIRTAAFRRVRDIATWQSFRPELEISAKLAVNGVEQFWYEPAITSEKVLEMRDARPGESSSDVAVSIDGSLLNLEIKTPAPQYERQNTRFAPFEREFRRRVTRVPGRERRWVQFSANLEILQFKADVGAIGRLLENEVRKLIQGRSDLVNEVVRYRGVPIGFLSAPPGDGAIGFGNTLTIRKEESGPIEVVGPLFRLDLFGLVHKEQLAGNCPNVVLFCLNEDGGLRIDDFLKDAAAEWPKASKRLSAVIFRMVDQSMHVSSNPDARHPLSPAQRSLLSTLG